MINPLQAATVVQAAETPGHALQVAHKRKMEKSWQPCNTQGIVFLPLAVESLGAWHKAAITEVKQLGSSLARHTGEEEATTIKHLFQQLSLALVKGNAALGEKGKVEKPGRRSQGGDGGAMVGAGIFGHQESESFHSDSSIFNHLCAVDWQSLDQVPVFG